MDKSDRSRKFIKKLIRNALSLLWFDWIESQPLDGVADISSTLRLAAPSGASWKYQNKSVMEKTIRYNFEHNLKCEFQHKLFTCCFRDYEIVVHYRKIMSSHKWRRNSEKKLFEMRERIYHQIYFILVLQNQDHVIHFCTSV